MRGKKCDVCKQCDALFKVNSLVDKDYEKTVCIGCWNNIPEQEKTKKKLSKMIVL